MKWFSALSLMIAAFLFNASAAQAQVKVINLNEYLQLAHQDNDTLYVINFWATWCGPCVKELPHFMKLQEQMENEAVAFIFVSLDDIDQLKKVNHFVNKRKWNMNTYLLNAGDPNEWINTIEPSWQGSIPATILYKQGVKVSFKEQYFDSEESLSHYISLHK